MRALGALLLALAAALAGRPAVADPPDVLVVEAASARPYALAREGLERALPRHVRVQATGLDLEEPEAEGRRVAAMGSRVLVTLGTQATSWALRFTSEVPVVFAMVLNPVQSGLVRTYGRPGPRITGASLDIPAEEHMRTLRDVLGARQVGLLYDPDQTAKVVGEALRAADRAGVELRAIPVSDVAALDRAFDRLGAVDALWSVPDRTVFGNGAAKEVLLQTLRRGMPFMGLSEQYVRSGALLALAVSYEENGRQAAERALRILDGEDPSRIPVSRPETIEVVMNPNTASRLGVEVPETNRQRLRWVD